MCMSCPRQLFRPETVKSIMEDVSVFETLGPVVGPKARIVVSDESETEIEEGEYVEPPVRRRDCVKYPLTSIEKYFITSRARFVHMERLRAKYGMALKGGNVHLSKLAAPWPEVCVFRLLRHRLNRSYPNPVDPEKNSKA